MVRTLSFYCRGHRFDPGSGTFHVPRYSQKEKKKKNRFCLHEAPEEAKLVQVTDREGRANWFLQPLIWAGRADAQGSESRCLSLRVNSISNPTQFTKVTMSPLQNQLPQAHFNNWRGKTESGNGAGKAVLWFYILWQQSSFP